MSIRKGVEELVQHHFNADPDLVQVYVFEPPEGEEGPVRLLEVNTATPATGSVDVFGFSASESVPFFVQIAEVTPSELDELKTNPSRLPNGWELDRARLIERIADR